MVEVTGTVDVSGSTINVDNTSFVQKSLENARRAKAKEDWEECEKYYNMVEQHDPKNIEAIFYSAYGKARMAMVESDRFKREQKMNVLKNSISVIDDNYDDSFDKYEDNQMLIEQIDTDIDNLRKSPYVYTQRTTNGISTNDSYYTRKMFLDVSYAWIESLQNIAHIIGDENKSLYLYKLIRDNYAYIYRNSYANDNKTMRQKRYNDVINAENKIKKLEPDYRPTIYVYTPSGCYVATCVYGSYDCPQVWTLRRYRDNTLAKTWYGRAFIRTYYAISPTIVNMFGGTAWFKKMWKGRLDKMVDKLQSEGVEDTPYNDVEW